MAARGPGHAPYDCRTRGRTRARSAGRGDHGTESVQYWQSFEHLERYAKDKSREHAPAWAAFNKAVGSNGDVGIWHETYRIRPGDYECVYNNMPPFGLAAATRIVPATGRREGAVGRMTDGHREGATE